MKFSKVALVVVVISTLSTGLHAERKKEVIAKHDSEKFFYNKGHKDGHDAGMRDGYAKAREEFLARINKYKKKIMAQQAGKFLSRKHKIAAPHIYQKKLPDGGIQVVVKGCSIEKELTPSEIMMLPEYDGTGYTEKKTYSSRYISNGGNKGTITGNQVSDNVFLPGVDEKKPQPKLSSSETRATYKFFPDTQFYRKVFRASGKPYAIVDNNRLKVIFASERSAIQFISRHNLKPGRDVQ